MSIGYPVLFLYRHAIELMLKGAMNSGWGHELDTLSDEFEAFIEREHNQKVPMWITRRLKEIAEIDPKSMSFRYGQKVSNKKQTNRVPLGGEHYIDLDHLQRAMTALYLSLRSVIRYELQHRENGRSP
jgi:hypothetical protein